MAITGRPQNKGGSVSRSVRRTGRREKIGGCAGACYSAHQNIGVPDMGQPCCPDCTCNCYGLAANLFSTCQGGQATY